MEEFHKNFPSLEKKLDKINEELYEAELAVRKEEFCKKYSTEEWNLLVKQKENIRTEDGCIHYRNRLTRTVYSWHLRSKEWRVLKASWDLSSLFS